MNISRLLASLTQLLIEARTAEENLNEPSLDVVKPLSEALGMATALSQATDFSEEDEGEDMLAKKLADDSDRAADWVKEGKLNNPKVIEPKKEPLLNEVSQPKEPPKETTA